MTDTLNPAALKHFRNQRGWSQEQLAAESNISKTQISRWERGKQTDRIRSSSRDRLCKALGVQWEDLTRPPTAEDILKLLDRVPLKGSIDGSARTFLTIVQRRFGLTEEAILDLAPLAVLILAEHSLQTRKATLDATVQALETATEEACRRLPYLAGAFRDGYDDDWIDEERRSINGRRLFVTYEDAAGCDHSPFIDFLEDRLRALNLFQKTPIEFSSRYSGLYAPRYPVPTPILGPIVGLDPDNDEDREVLGRIQDGRIDLRKVLEKKNAVGAEEDYRCWLDEQNQKVTEELESELTDLF